MFGCMAACLIEGVVLAFNVPECGNHPMEKDGREIHGSRFSGPLIAAGIRRQVISISHYPYLPVIVEAMRRCTHLADVA